MTWTHADSWRETALMLGLDIEGPLELDLATGVMPVDLLVRDFGAPNGIAIISDYEAILPHRTALTAQGYTASSFKPPAPGVHLSPEDIIELLADWTWTGALDRRPAWLPAEPDALANGATS